MNKQEFIERMKSLKNLFGNKAEYIEIDTVIELASKLDEPEAGHADEAPRYVKNILARLRELPLHDREVWLKAIMGEFEQDFSRAKWREGYEQGKVEGLIEREKVTVPQFVADWIEYCKEHNFTLFGCLDPANGFESLAGETFEGDVRKCIRWCRKESNNFARAWLDGYKIAEGTKYKVIIKGVSPNSCMLKYYHDTERWIMGASINFNDSRLYHTKEELEAGGFSEVFNSPLFEVEEVE